jgi:hydroxyacylglutathione hydrolase
MLIHQFVAKGLAHYSYAVGSKESHEVAIIDPERDIKTYLNYAAENRLKITHVLETHIHADFASGARELAEKTGAELLLSAYDKGEKYEYAFPHKELHDGDAIHMDGITIKALHTPGHTPEHMSFAATQNGESAPKALFSGDFLFVGALGRPDLLGDDAKEALAHQLYKSVRTKLKDLPDSVEVYPGHGAGSLCGSGMGKASSSTMGDERQMNPYLQKMSEAEFVEKILSASPEFPDYYLRMKQLNSKGAPILEGLTRLGKPLEIDEFAAHACNEGVILDVRHPLAFGGGHIDGSVNIGMPDQLSFWAAWVMPYNKPIYLVVEDETHVRPTIQALVRVGLDDIRGYLRPGFVNWVNSGKDFIDLPQASVHALNDFLEIGEPITVLDVRSKGEWNDGHIEGAKHIYLGDLHKKIKQLNDPEETIFCICGGGNRSSIASSILMMNGFENVYNVFGGMTAWNAAGYPTQKVKAKKAEAVS